MSMQATGTSGTVTQSGAGRCGAGDRSALRSRPRRGRQSGPDPQEANVVIPQVHRLSGSQRGCSRSTAAAAARRPRRTPSPCLVMLHEGPGPSAPRHVWLSEAGTPAPYCRPVAREVVPVGRVRPGRTLPEFGRALDLVLAPIDVDLLLAPLDPLDARRGKQDLAPEDPRAGIHDDLADTHLGAGLIHLAVPIGGVHLKARELLALHHGTLGIPEVRGSRVVRHHRFSSPGSDNCTRELPRCEPIYRVPGSRWRRPMGRQPQVVLLSAGCLALTGIGTSTG